MKFKINKIKAIAYFALVASLTSCQKDSVQSLPKRSWSLTWSDEFNGTAGTAPDNSKWNYDLGTGVNGWGNSELQTYTNLPSNIQLDGTGKLMITARTGGFTSARINTKGKFAQAYGRFEARIKTTHGPGIWPAFWMMGANIDSKPWPQCGEIDILEQKGQEPHITYSTIHGPGYSGGSSIGKMFSLENDRFDNDYHLYSVEWGTDFIDFFVDDFLFHRITPDQVKAKGEWVFNQPFFLILNVAVGGNYVGFPTSGTPFPQTMLVDYVRVYKQM
ncbi:MAG: glycoside hydrolase family 16 protein [Chitinophagaceae bacterium]